MKIISHRGNINGQELLTENTPEAIDRAIDRFGMDVEIDVWMVDGKFMIGHDFGAYEVNLDFFINRAEKLWIHCKNLEALTRLGNFKDLNIFWHEEDTYTLTSKGYIWAYPGVDKNECVVEVNLSGDIKDTYPFAVCTDYPIKFI